MSYENKPNIVFLDVDGVINSSHTKKRSPEGFTGVDPLNLKYLADIVNCNEAQIILSSSWRSEWLNGNFNDKAKPDAEYLMGELAKLDLHILGMTPYVPEGTHCRGLEIITWLNEHPHKHYVILDDEVFDFPKRGIAAHWCRTSFMTGLTQANVKEANRIMLADLPDVNEKAAEKFNKEFLEHFGRQL